MIPNWICDQWFYFQGVFFSGITLYEVYKLINETNSNAWGVIGFIAGVVGVLIQLALLPCGYNFLFSVVPENTFLETQFELSSIIACCFILAACKSKWVFKGLCEVGLLQYLGKISYSLYLWHWLIINTVLQIKFNSYAQGVVAMVLSIIIAHISFRFIEEPFMKSKYLKSQWDKIFGD